MSATARHLDPQHDPQLHEPDGAEVADRRSRAQLRLVSPLRPERASRGVFALLITGLLGLGLVGMLVINTQLAQGAFIVSDLTQERAKLAEQEAVLKQDVAAAAAPNALAQRARGLGMVQSQTPAFLRIQIGRAHV